MYIYTQSNGYGEKRLGQKRKTVVEIKDKDEDRKRK